MANRMYKNFIGEKTTLTSRTWGEVTIESAEFTDAIDGDLVLTKGSPYSHTAPLVRIHSECVFAEVFDSSLCDCADQMHMALAQICKEDCGIFYYLRLDGRGAGLSAKVKATCLEVNGLDTHDSRIEIGVPPDSRDYLKIAEHLSRNGIKRIRLLTNNPEKSKTLEDRGIHVETIGLQVTSPNDEVAKLYRTKAKKFGHSVKLEPHIDTKK